MRDGVDLASLTSFGSWRGVEHLGILASSAGRWRGLDLERWQCLSPVTNLGDLSLRLAAAECRTMSRLNDSPHHPYSEFLRVVPFLFHPP